MTIPEHVIEAARAAIAHRAPTHSGRKYFIDVEHVESILEAAFAALWQPIESADGKRPFLIRQISKPGVVYLARIQDVGAGNVVKRDRLTYISYVDSYEPRTLLRNGYWIECELRDIEWAPLPSPKGSEK